jgi:protein SCO1/2
MGSAGVVAVVTLWLTAPPFWRFFKETSVDRAVKTDSGSAWWWPDSWRVDLMDRKLVWTTDVGGATTRWSELHELDRVKMYTSTTESDGTVEGVAPVRLACIRDVPEFVLTDQAGKSFRMSDCKGTVLLVSFIFTTCNGSCPATTHRMSLVQQELKSRGLLEDGRVRLVSITLDPARDTPEVLARYMRLYDADPEHWSFLTGPVEDVQRTITAWDMWVRPTANGQLDHPSRIFLVDQKAKVREIYNLSFLKPAWAVDDVKLLLDESAPTSDE